jgi:hypothetical protein
MTPTCTYVPDRLNNALYNDRNLGNGYSLPEQTSGPWVNDPSQPIGYSDPNIPQRLVPPNAFNRCLQSEAQTWLAIQRSGGLRTLCCRMGYPGIWYEKSPWVVQPRNAVRFDKINSITLPGIPEEGTDVIVLQWRVPLGYDGVIKGFVNQFAGTGFAEASGDLTWRVQANRRWLKDYGNIITTLGSLQYNQEAYGDGVRIFSDQLITYYVNVAAGADGRLQNDGKVICALQGWYYPL